MAFTFFMALIATYAEPALNAMGITTEQLTKGAFKRTVLLLAVALGVGLGVMLGVARMVWEWNLTVMLCIGYSLAVALTIPSRLEYVAVAWDCAGVTTSSITVPLVLAMGLGLGNELQVQDAFGLLAMGSVGPICSVLTAGLLVRFFAPAAPPTEEDLEKIFDSIDVNNDKSISREEWIARFGNDDLFDEFDADNSGSVSIQEFVTAGMKKAQFELEIEISSSTSESNSSGQPTGPQSPASIIAAAYKNMSLRLEAAAAKEAPKNDPTDDTSGRWGRAGSTGAATSELPTTKVGDGQGVAEI